MASRPPSEDENLAAFLKGQQASDPAAAEFVNRLGDGPQESVTKKAVQRRDAMKMGMGGVIAVVVYIAFRAFRAWRRQQERE